MKTKEFIKAVKKLGYEAGMDDEWVSIVYKNKTLAHIFTKELYRMSSYFSNIDCGENAGILFALIFQYAVTPVEEREEEKKYYLIHRYFRIAGGGSGFFTIENASGLSFLKYKTNLDHYSQKFTEKEIEELKEKLNTNLDGFEMVEVEDDD